MDLARRRPLLAVAAVVAALAALPSAAYAASWTAPRTIAERADVQFDVAMGADGTVAAVWAVDGAVRAAVKPPGAAWSRTVRVSDGRYGVARPAVAVTGRGEIVAAWAQNGTLNSEGGPYVGPLTIRARARGVGGTWGTIRRIGTSGHFITAGVDLAANARGETIAVWRGVRRLADGRSSEAVQSAFRAPSTAFGGTQTIRDPESTQLTVALPVAGLDARGTAHAAYTAGTGPVVRLASRNRGTRGSWNAPRNLGTVPSSAPVLAVAPDRSTTIAWRASELDSEGEGVQSGLLDARVRRPDGTLSATQRLSSEPTRSFGVTASPGGEVLATWTPSAVIEPVPARELHAARRPPEGPFGPPEIVAGVAPSSDFHVAPAALGDGTFLQPYTADRDRARVISRRSGGVFAPAPELDVPGLYPLVAAAGARAVAVWAVADGETVALAASARIG